MQQYQGDDCNIVKKIKENKSMSNMSQEQGNARYRSLNAPHDKKYEKIYQEWSAQ